MGKSSDAYYYTTEPFGLYGFKNDDVKTTREFVCDGCGKKYKRMGCEMPYLFKFSYKTLQFCDYNCRSKWKKEHFIEIEYDKVHPRFPKNRKRKKRKEEEYENQAIWEKH